MKAMRRMRRRMRRINSLGEMGLVVGMEDDRSYSLAHPNGRMAFPYGPMKGWQWKVWYGVPGYPMDYEP